MKKEDRGLVEQFRQETGGNGINTLFKIIDSMIAGHHKANEDATGDEFLRTQGKIKGLRDLEKRLLRKIKT